MNSERLKYIDAAKGILILIVVIHHIPHVLSKACIHDDFFNLIDGNSFWYISFFMPAFFIITGLVSSNKTICLKEFLKKNFKLLLIPALTMGLLSSYITMISSGNTHVQEYALQPIKVVYALIKIGGGYWFITSLFIAKLIYWSLLKVKAVSQRVIILLVLCIGGVLLYNHSVYEPWRIYHAMILVPFLQIGDFLKRISITQRMGGCSSVIFILTTIVYSFMGISIPSITATVSINVLHLPYLFLLSISGTLTVLWISQYFSSSTVLTYLGRNSLIIYCLHISILTFLCPLFIGLYGNNALLSMIVLLMLLAGTIGIISLLAWCLKQKKLPILIGKF